MGAGRGDSMTHGPSNDVAPGEHRSEPGAEQRQGIEQLRRAVQLFNAAERRLRGRHQRTGGSLSYGHLRALFVLTAEDEVTAGRLAREAELNPASVTAMVDQLEGRGLVTRRRDEHDRRVCWISLTDEGRSEVAETEARWSRRLAEAFADMPDEDLDTASRVIERLAAVFEVREGDDAVE
jgi:MarR family transcriptional regulator, organic hydroperoxide resistance regulator